MQPRLELINESSLLIYFADDIAAENIAIMALLTEQIKAELGPAFSDSIQAFASLMICFKPLQYEPEKVLSLAENLLAKLDTQTINSTIKEPVIIALPVYYGPEAGLDLKTLTTELNLSEEEIIQLHTEKTYDVYSLGFSPGFAFMGKLNERLKTARKATPRPNVPTGSVAIAEYQTTVYPSTTPGGWHIIGRCPLCLFDSSKQPPNLLQTANKVQFKAIDKNEFLALGGTLDN
jgi:KipI family sensor histidine kinase inhibitor